jgi:hypothetical protein
MSFDKQNCHSKYPLVSKLIWNQKQIHKIGKWLKNDMKAKRDTPSQISGNVTYTDQYQTSDDLMTRH